MIMSHGYGSSITLRCNIGDGGGGASKIFAQGTKVSLGGTATYTRI